MNTPGSDPTNDRVPQVPRTWGPGRDFNGRNVVQRFLGPLIICFAAFIATTPDLIWGNSCGHDFDFHLASWIDAQAAWRHGLFYPHWAPSPNWGAGEPRFVFYPPLTWMLGAAFGTIFPWKGVQLAILCSFLALTGLATRALARQFGLSDGPATLAGCAALFSGYSMFTAYERSAFGELAGGFWIPLLLLLILRDGNSQAPVFRRALNGSGFLLALVVAGAWLSNAPLGVMASYLLAAIALVLALIRRSWSPILRATIAAALGIGLFALYLVPAAVEQRWVQIRQAVDDPGLAIENSFLFARHANPNLELHDVELMRVSIIAVIMLAITLLGVFIAGRRGKLPKDRTLWIPLALIPVAILFLQLPVSLPIWNALPKLRFLQFPWRWLVALEAPTGIFFAAALWPTRLLFRNLVVAGCTLLFLGTTAASLQIFHQGCDAEDRVSGMLSAYRSGQGFEGVDEYAPPRADNSIVPIGVPDACLVANATTVLAPASQDGTVPEWDPANGHCDATYSWFRNEGSVDPEHRKIVADIPHAGFLILHLRDYAAWQVRVNDRLLAFGANPTLTPLPQRDDGMMAVPVPQGHVDLAIDWTTTRDVIIGRWLSLLSLLLLAALYIAERRASSPSAPPPKVSL
ncbi:hypothetical protein [Occallatibacter savannae]|uniref:hypothetical protein n=1 Tax=Occallatibacter savannae TaxID=1002691 RepID=UPI000D6895C6|nr:hypothetical protein [Occallatibacter savannae]